MGSIPVRVKSSGEMNTVMTNEEAIAAKKAEIADYERILAAYRGRWWDMGKRHLDQLKEELSLLETTLV